MNDLERARRLGITVEEFQSLVGHDPLDTYTEFTQGGVMSPKDTRQYDGEPKDKKKKKEKKEKKTDATGLDSSDNFGDIGDGTKVPFETDKDIRNKTARELEHYWDRPIESEADEALYYGFHIHGKDNAFGLHAHYPGGPLGGGHKHGPQDQLGHHTHRYSREELLQFKFARPGIMIDIDGSHTHEHNAPDGKHIHQEENFGPASDYRADMVADRNERVDKN